MRTASFIRAMMMEGGRTSETSVYFNEITQRYILEVYHVLDSFFVSRTHLAPIEIMKYSMVIMDR
jgi:hypothetical protein